MAGLRLHRHRILPRRNPCRRGGTAAIGTVGRGNAFILPDMMGGGGGRKRMTMMIIVVIATAAVEGGRVGGVEVAAEEE